MSCARRSSSVMISTEAPWRSPLRSMARTEVPICTAVSASTTSTASVRRREASACVRADAEAGDDLLDRRQLLLRGAGRLAGAAGDLLHRAAQLFGRGGGFGQAACQLLGRRGETLGELVLGAAGNPLASAVRLGRPHGRPVHGRIDDRPRGCSGVQLGFLDEGHGVLWNTAQFIRTDAVAGTLLGGGHCSGEGQP